MNLLAIFAQSRRHYKYPTQTFLQRYGFLRAKPGAYPATQAGALIPLGHALGVQNNGISGAPPHTGAASGAGLFINQRKVVGGIDQRKRAAAPELQGITTILAAVADAGFGA